jgi:signal transduction histidine kinase
LEVKGVVAAAAAGCVVFSVLLRHLSDRPGRGADWPLMLALGVVTIAAGLVGWHRRPDTRIGPLMVLAGFLVYLNALLRSNDAWAFSLGNLLTGWGTAVFIHVIATYPTGRAETRLERAVVVYGYAAATVVCVARATTTDFAPTCALCPTNQLYVGGYPGVFDAMNGVSAALIVLANVGIAAVLVAKWRRAGPAGRRVLVPLCVSALATVITVIAIHPDFDNRGPTAGGGWIVGAAILTFPVALLLGLLRSRLARAAVSDMLVELEQQGDLEAAAARALGDPSARLVRWNRTEPDSSPDVPGRRRAVVEREGQRLAVIEFDAALADEPERLSAVLSALALAMDRDRLAHEVRARLDEVASSRLRIVTAADDERRRIERNLHDGAQQRLVGASMLVRRARTRAAASADAEQERLLAQAADEVDRSLREIRELARGLLPPLLDEQGLVAALDSLAERSAVPTTVYGHLDTRLPRTIETAAFFVVSECLANTAKHAAATHAQVTLSTDHDVLVLSVADDGHGGATLDNGSGLRGLRDRVEAIDGTLELCSDVEHGTTVIARLPCRP